jgi:hypothetical protein
VFSVDIPEECETNPALWSLHIPCLSRPGQGRHYGERVYQQARESVRKTEQTSLSRGYHAQSA